MAKLSGHLWTLYPHLRGLVLGAAAPRGTVAWECLAPAVPGPDGAGGDEPVRVRGEWTDVAAASEAVVLVHGLGGRPESPVCRSAAREFARRGVATLNLALRGADRSGEDLYHGGLAVDLEAAFASPELARFERLYAVGFSMGGHAALHLARSATDHPRLAAVAAIASPIELGGVQRFIDGPRARFYRRQVLRGLGEIYRAWAVRHPDRAPLPPDGVARLTSLRAFDERVICPRFGFESADHYYRSVGIAEHLGALERPVLLVHAEQDPMVPPPLVEPFLPAPDSVRGVPPTCVRTSTGGHMGFPRRLDLGLGIAERGLVGQVLGWARALPALASDRS